MQARAELKVAAKRQLTGKWGSAIGFFVVYYVIVMAINVMSNVSDNQALASLGGILSLVLTGPLMFSMTSYFYRLVTGQSAALENIGDGFKNFLPSFLCYLWVCLKVLFWMLPALLIGFIVIFMGIASVGVAANATGLDVSGLGPAMLGFAGLCFIAAMVPGIMATLRYSQAFFVLVENPSIGAVGAVNESIRLMKGHVGELFVLYLSFIGWAILATIPCGLGWIALTPYMQTTVTNYYLALKADAGGNQPMAAVVTEEVIEAETAA